MLSRPVDLLGSIVSSQKPGPEVPLSATNFAQYVSLADAVLIILTVWLWDVCVGSCDILSTWSWNTLIEVLVLPPVAVIVNALDLVNCSVVWYFVTVNPDILNASIPALIFVSASS